MATVTQTTGDIQMSSAQLTVGGTDIGATNGGIKFTPTVSIQKVYTDQSSMPKRHFITQEDASLTANLCEYNLTKLNLVSVGGTYTLDAGAVKKSIYYGGKQIATTDYVELVVTPTTDGIGTISTDANLKITIFKCIPVTRPELSFTKDGVRYVPTTFEAVADETKTTGKQFYLLGDSTATA